MTDNLEPGWYWVKWDKDDEWEVGLRATDFWGRTGFDSMADDFTPAIIGPRLTPPDTEKGD